MKLTSHAFKHDGEIPIEYTCQGSNVSPPLEIHDAPTNAKSLVLIMDDPDVPKQIRPDGIWDHWVVFNIDPRVKVFKEGMSSGILGKNTSGENDYQGPCPPDKRHRYFFKLYALDCLLNLKEGASKKQVEDAMKSHVLAQAELMATYEKS